MEWYRLRCAGLSDSYIRALLKITKDYREIYKLEREQLIKYLKFDEEALKKLQTAKNIDLVEELNKLVQNKVKLIFIEDEAYPESLKNIASPPLFLYCRGDVKKLKDFSLAVVGTRKPSSYGRGTTEKFVEGIVKGGITTVSGLALGIDTICHRKTIALGGNTVAVVGSGLDVIYPKENRELWELIPRHGVLVSEFPLGTEPHNYNFPQRNRIIVGLSKGVLVTESRIKGGSLITAEFALEEGRDIFAVPGEIFSPFSEGCNNLIKNNQAKLVTGISDIFSEYGMKEKKIQNDDVDLKLTGLEKLVYDKLIGAKNLDELIMDTRLKSTEVLTLLVELEIKQLVTSVPGGAYRRKK